MGLQYRIPEIKLLSVILYDQLLYYFQYFIDEGIEYDPEYVFHDVKVRQPIFLTLKIRAFLCKTFHFMHTRMDF